MEEEKKDLKEESAAKAKKQMRRKYIKRFLVIYMIVILLSIAIALVLRETGAINRYAYEKVENLGEREGVCFDNLLLSYIIVVHRGDQREERWLCIMNNGDVYAFEWNNGWRSWDWYFSGDEIMDDNEVHPNKGYDEANWEKMENVVYLGRFSNGAVRQLNSYVENFDLDGKYYYLYPPEMSEPQGGGVQQERGHERENEEVEWKGRWAYLYLHGYRSRIEWCHMNQTWWGGYEKEIYERSLDENAIAAIKLFESSGFYSRWVKMCLNGY